MSQASASSIGNFQSRLFAHHIDELSSIPPPLTQDGKDNLVSQNMFTMNSSSSVTVPASTSLLEERANPTLADVMSLLMTLRQDITVSCI